MNKDQITLRLPRELVRALDQRARARGVRKSQLVREAVSAYLAEPEPLSREEFYRRAKLFIGAFPGDHEAAMKDPWARQIYENNWRE